jgi:hypothetical protein
MKSALWSWGGSCWSLRGGRSERWIVLAGDRCEVALLTNGGNLSLEGVMDGEFLMWSLGFRFWICWRRKSSYSSNALP